MIGSISGDIIGSPYVNNPVGAVTDIFFPLFASSEKVEVDSARGRARSRTYEAKPGVCSLLSMAAAQWYMSGDFSWANWDEIVSSYIGERRVSHAEALVVSGTLARLARNANELSVLSGVVAESFFASDSQDLSFFRSYTNSLFRFMVTSSFDKGLAAMRFTLKDSGLDVSRNTSEIRPFLDGIVRYGEDRKTLMGDGKRNLDLENVIPAVLAVVGESRSYEEAVRRAVAVGGNSSVMASLVGSVAELRWQVPDAIRERAVDYLPFEQRAVVEHYRRFMDIRAGRDVVVPGPRKDNMFHAIRMEGYGSIYIVPEDRSDIVTAIHKTNAALGKSEKSGDYVIISPEKKAETLARLSSQVDASGNVLDGVFAEHPRPELKSLWLEDGVIRNVFTRSGAGRNGRDLPSLEKRSATMNDFVQLKKHAEDVRNELESRVGFGLQSVFAEKLLRLTGSYEDRLSDGEGFNEDTFKILKNISYYLEGIVNSNLSIQEIKDNVLKFCGKNPWMDGFVKGVDVAEKETLSMKGVHLHFKSAFYPVVYDQSIEIMQGDILRARVRIDENGCFGVDTDAMTGGVHKEGIDGVLDTMNLVSKNASMDEFRAALDEYCLDFGRIEDEDEREALDVDDSESDAVKKKYESNVDRAIADVNSVNSYGVAVMPDGPVLSGKAEAVREERRAESEERYAGMTRQDAVDSQAHKGSVFTIGHSNMSQEEFDSLMKRHGIQVLVDIRSYPKSNFCPQFDKDTLDVHLAGNDIEYHHFPEFGGHQMVGSGDARRQLSYEEVMKSDDFKNGMKCLRDCVKEGYRVCLMCSENDPLECHRMLMMGRALAHPEVYGSRAKAIDVQHITRQGYTLSQDYFEKKLVKTYAPVLNMENKDMSDKVMLDSAFRMREKAIAEKTLKRTRITGKRAVKVAGSNSYKRGRR